MLDPSLKIVEACKRNSINWEGSDQGGWETSEKVPYPLFLVASGKHLANGGCFPFCTYLDLSFYDVNRVADEPTKGTS